MRFEQILNIPITEDEIKKAIIKSQQNLFLDNLRDRHLNVAFDCKIRGYVGEIALKKWFFENGISVITQNYISEGQNMDIDFLYKNIDIELKTSLIPDIDQNLQTVFQKRDIKIIKRTENISDLKGDIHIQIYYQHNTRMKDEWLKEQLIDLKSADIDYLYEKLLGKSYLNKSFLFCWIDRFTLEKRILNLPLEKRTWKHGKRDFWVCPLRNSLAPIDLISFLKRF